MYDTGWREENNKLSREFKFKDFKAAFAFMQRVAFECEAMDHHPDWENVYNRVRIALTTHSAGAVTELDRELARRIDGIHGEWN